MANSTFIKTHIHFKEVETKNIGLHRSTSLKRIDCGFFRDLKEYFGEHSTFKDLKMIKIIVIYYFIINLELESQ